MLSSSDHRSIENGYERTGAFKLDLARQDNPVYSLSKAKSHVTSPVCFVGDVTAIEPSADNYCIGGCDDLEAWLKQQSPKRSSFCVVQ